MCSRVVCSALGASFDAKCSHELRHDEHDAGVMDVSYDLPVSAAGIVAHVTRGLPAASEDSFELKDTICEIKRKHCMCHKCDKHLLCVSLARCTRRLEPSPPCC